MTADSPRPPTMSGPAGVGEASGRDGLLVEVLIWLGATVVAGSLIFWLLDGLRVGRVWPFSRTLDGSSMYDLSRSTVALTGLLGATVAVVIGIRRQKSTERSVRISSEAQLITAEAYKLEFERQLISERTHAGLASARARGRRGGRPAALSPDQVALLRQLYDARQYTVIQIAGLLGIARATVYRYLDTQS